MGTAQPCLSEASFKGYPLKLKGSRPYSETLVYAEQLSGDKHSSLFVQSINDEEKNVS